MPTELHISAHIERFCHPCIHLHFANAFYGSNFVRGDYECMHPKAHDLVPTPTDPEKARLVAKLESFLRKSGRQIGKKDRRPSWCPLYKSET